MINAKNKNELNDRLIKVKYDALIILKNKILTCLSEIFCFLNVYGFFKKC